eukprot:PLAT3856.10.p1 GENE.PLAT3856.10~~PLAT3856.10.p1  ORF type:complete len:398 (+),score=202.84 PLAT3856.10:49-1194(+)
MGRSRKGKSERAAARVLQAAARREERAKKKSLRKQRYKHAAAVERRDVGVLKLQLARQRLQLREVKGDGSCLFRSISDQMDGGEDSHAIYRAMAVAHMREHSDDFAPFIVDEPFDDYCSRMARDRVWGGNMELQALSQALAVTIIIHQVNAPRYELRNGERTLHIGYSGNQHYDSVRALGDVGAGPPAPIVLPSAAELAAAAAATRAPPKAEEEPTDDELLVMRGSGCTSLLHVRRILKLLDGSVEEALELVIAEAAEGADWAVVAAREEVMAAAEAEAGGKQDKEGKEEAEAEEEEARRTSKADRAAAKAARKRAARAAAVKRTRMSNAERKRARAAAKAAARESGGKKKAVERGRTKERKKKRGEDVELQEACLAPVVI